MPGTCFNGIWDCAHVLNSELKPTGVMTCQLGDIKSKTVSETEAVLYHSPGIVGRPADPSADGDVCEAIVLKDSWGDCIIGVRDFVGAKLAGELQPGEAAAYCASSMARALFKKDGSVTLYTTDDNTPTGQSVFLSVGPDGIKMGGPWGAFTLTKDGLQMASRGGSWVLLSDDGSATVGGSTVNVAGGSVALGIGATLPLATIGPGGPVPATAVFGK